jgi:hypothetical protein
VPRHRKPPVALPNASDAVRRAIDRVAVASGGR